MNKQHHSILIIGGGAAGVSVANTLHRSKAKFDIAIIEPSEKHYYQPGFTIIGGGVYTMRQATRNEADLINADVTWIKECAATFQPEANTVTLASGAVVGYDYLVVCPGLQLDWSKVEGLKDTLGKNNVCSIYSAATAEHTWECIRTADGGTAIFTQPPMPIKCAGAPQKIMYLAADRFRKKGILDKFSIEFCTAGPSMFGVPYFAKELLKVIAGYGIKASFGQNLVAVDGPGKTATFETTDAAGMKERITKKFDLLHVTPPQSAPDFIKTSPLANAAGWVDVNERTLQHNKYPNIFSLGDAAATSNAKTAAAVRKQVPVVIDNLMHVINKSTVQAAYDGYGSCPLTTSLNTVMLAEFSYGGKVTPTFPIDPRKNRFIWWLCKTTGFPWLYWHWMLKGRRFDIAHKESKAKGFE
jgi:sulfide:quinone oxidoreductase